MNAREITGQPMLDAFPLPDFSVAVWLRKTEKFAALKSELLGACPNIKQILLAKDERVRFQLAA
jgi:hypothetical protein